MRNGLFGGDHTLAESMDELKNCTIAFSQPNLTLNSIYYCMLQDTGAISKLNSVHKIRMTYFWYKMKLDEIETKLDLLPI